MNKTQRTSTDPKGNSEAPKRLEDLLQELLASASGGGSDPDTSGGGGCGCGGGSLPFAAGGTSCKG